MALMKAKFHGETGKSFYRRAQSDKWHKIKTS